MCRTLEAFGRIPSHPGDCSFDFRASTFDFRASTFDLRASTFDLRRAGVIFVSCLVSCGHLQKTHATQVGLQKLRFDMLASIRHARFDIASDIQVTLISLAWFILIRAILRAANSTGLPLSFERYVRRFDTFRFVTLALQVETS